MNQTFSEFCKAVMARNNDGDGPTAQEAWEGRQPEIDALTRELEPSPCGKEGHRRGDWVPDPKGNEAWHKAFPNMRTCLACQREQALAAAEREMYIAAVNVDQLILDQTKRAEDAERERDEARALSNKIVCSYCGKVDEKEDSPNSTSLKMVEHILACEKNPANALVIENVVLREQVKELSKELARVNDEYIRETAKRLEFEGERDAAGAACVEAGETALRTIQAGLASIVEDEDLDEETLQEHSESTLPNLCDVATKALAAYHALPPTKDAPHERS